MDRLNKKKIKFIWQLDDHDTNIFTEVFYERYTCPRGFDFDPRNHNDGTINSQNIQWKADNLVGYFKSTAYHYPGNNYI